MLLVDVGTNAEIVLGNRARTVACSSPTGPAFEGAEISGGQRAAPGAIERVRIDPETLEPRYRVIGSELVQKYVGEGARMVRELFEMARTKKACIIFFDEIDAVGGARFDDGAGGDNEVQRTMLELITQLDGFDARGNIKVMFATNRPSTLDPALMRPGRIDRKIEFSLPDMEGRANILRIHAKSMSVERDIRWELISRLCPNSTGAELRSVATEAGMYAIR